MESADVDILRTGWTADPADPDFFIDVAHPPLGSLRVHPRWPLALALFVVEKRLSLERRSPPGGPPFTRVIVGMTFVHRVFGGRVDGMLLRLVRFEHSRPSRDPPRGPA